MEIEKKRQSDEETKCASPTSSLRLSISPSLYRRLAKTRTGSVLIIVIVLLLLLAILGAAYISTTRSARVASAQNVLSSDVDSMVDGVSKVCQGVILDDLNDTFGNLHGNTAYTANTITNRSIYQGQAGLTTALNVLPDVPPATGAPAGYTYNPGDLVNGNTNGYYPIFYGLQGTATSTVTAAMAPSGTPGTGWQVMNGNLPITAVGTDPWLADRVPIPDPAGSGLPWWTSITQTISQTNPPAPLSIMGTPFVDPTTGQTIVRSTTGAGPLIGTPSSSGPLTPGYKVLPNGLNVPAFGYGPATFAAAADADGDGIADSLFFAIPGASYDGLTWYAAVRIIDNNSAINANTAWSRNGNSAPDAWNLFQTSVGLQEIANTGDLQGGQLSNVNKYRFNGTTTVGATPYDDSGINGNTPPAPLARGDYSFISPSDGYYNQLIRRIANPGVNTGTTRYQPFPLSDEAALAYHFCLQNPSSMAQSVLEAVLPASLAGTGTTAVPSSPYDPSDAADWFKNFNYPIGTDAVTAPQYLRALVVSRNPVSNYIQQVYNNNTTANGGEGPTSSDPILPNYMLPYGPNTAAGAPYPSHYRGIYGSKISYSPNDIVTYPGTAGTPYDGPTSTYINTTAAAGLAPVPATPTPPPATNVYTGVSAGWELQPWTSNPVKANVNTATFRELLRAFWCVMSGNPSNATPFGYTPDDANGIYDDTMTNPQFEFRSPLRDPNSATPGTASELDQPAANFASKTATNTNTMLLRAAIAAVNALGLRDNSQNIISKTIILKNAWVATSGGAPALTDVEARVYSSAPQPVIAEVYVNTNSGPDPTGASPTPNPAGYVAVELFNPYPVPLTLINWTLAYVNRQTNANGGTYPNLQPAVIGTIGTPASPVIIQPSGYLLIENLKYTGAPTTQPDPDTAVYRPADSGIQSTPPLNGPWSGPATPPTPATMPSTAGGTMYGDVYMPFLEDVIKGTTAVPPGGTAPSTGGELVLLRPRRADGTLTTYIDPNNNGATAGIESFDEKNNTADLVPLDSYDFTSLQQGAPGSVYEVWHYVRPNGHDPTSGNYLFKATYPGPYNAMALGPRETTTYAQPVTPPASPVFATSTSGSGTPTAPIPSTQPSFGTTTYGNYADNFPPVQVYNVGNLGNDSGGNPISGHFPNPVVAPDTVTGVTQNASQPFSHPFGGFARNGDMLDIPFIGAYRIRAVNAGDTSLTYSANSFVELNSVTMDCSLAAVETGNANEDAAQNIGRFVPMAASFSYLSQLQNGATNLPDYYAWSRNLFNYLTVQSSSDAYMPNFDPNISSSNYTGTPTFAYPPANAAANPVPATPTLTANATAPDQTLQDNVGVEGLININTASWKVLSMLPFVANNPGGVDQTIAQNIVTYRLKYGPFMSIFDLNQVPGFQNGTGATTAPPAAPPAPSSALGLMSPADSGFGTAAPNQNSPLGTEEDYQWDTLTLSRISNLVTTRSDTFTVYVEVQGWQNVGSANAQPMITRRYAFIVDRTGVNADPSTRFLKTLTVPNN
jgi:hypothetical protein